MKETPAPPPVKKPHPLLAGPPRVVKKSMTTSTGTRVPKKPSKPKDRVPLKASPKKAKTPEPEIDPPYLFERTEIRKGTFDWPYLYSICRTQGSAGRVSEPIFFNVLALLPSGIIFTQSSPFYRDKISLWVEIISEIIHHRLL